MTSTRITHLVNAGLLILLVGGSLYAFPILPEEIPKRFDVTGQVTASWEATTVHWFLLPLVATVLVGVTYGLAVRDGEGLPEPDQAQYEASSADEKDVKGASKPLYWMLVPVLTLLGVVQHGIYTGATTTRSGLPAYDIAGIGVMVALIVGLVGWRLWRLQRNARSRGTDSDE